LISTKQGLMQFSRPQRTHNYGHKKNSSYWNEIKMYFTLLYRLQTHTHRQTDTTENSTIFATLSPSGWHICIKYTVGRKMCHFNFHD